MTMTLPAFAQQDTLREIMRAAVLFGPQDIRLIDRPLPKPHSGEVLVKVAMCGTCGTDLKIYDGHFPLTLPLGAFTPGHEWTGTVVAGLDTAGGYIAGYDIAIFGPGPVGLMTVQACKQLGAASVILVGTRTSRLEMGRRLGADHLVNIRERDPLAAIRELTDGAGVDLAIECSGAVETPQQCVQVTKRGGKILVVAFYPQPVTLDLSAVVRSDITIYTTRGEGGNNVKRAVSLAAQGRLRGSDLITHEFPLEDIAEAFRVMRERIDEPIKIVIVP